MVTGSGLPIPLILLMILVSPPDKTLPAELASFLEVAFTEVFLAAVLELIFLALDFLALGCKDEVPVDAELSYESSSGSTLLNQPFFCPPHSLLLSYSTIIFVLGKEVPHRS